MEHDNSNSKAMQRDADEVREYLVTMRGGAPFLSGADARLLVSWLEKGIPVPLILSCLDQVAAKRRKRRTKSRLSLNACKSTVRKAWAPPDVSASSTEPAAPIQTGQGLGIIVDEVRNLTAHCVGDAEALQTLATQLDTLQPSGSDPDATQKLALHVLALFRQFHESLWNGSGPAQQTLREQAETELAPMKSALSDRQFQDLTEEIARDHLRARYPIVSAQFVWDTLFGTSTSP